MNHENEAAFARSEQDRISRYRLRPHLWRLRKIIENDIENVGDDESKSHGCLSYLQMNDLLDDITNLYEMQIKLDSGLSYYQENGYLEDVIAEDLCSKSILVRILRACMDKYSYSKKEVI